MMSTRNVIFMAAIMMATIQTAAADSFNEKVVAFLKSKVGARVGGGECAHAASEALRVAGGAFEESDLGADHPAPGDYVWGTLVKVISYSDENLTDSHPDAKVMPGDILQYHQTRFVYVTQTGNVTTTRTAVATHHTSIASKVDTEGLFPTEVFEQNAPTPTNIQTRAILQSSINFPSMRSGWVRIYRPKPRTDMAGKYQATIVNNTPLAQKVAIHFEGAAVFDVSLTPMNTASSYTLPSMISTSPTQKFTIVMENGAKTTIENARGYEVFTAQNGSIGVRQLDK